MKTTRLPSPPAVLVPLLLFASLPVRSLQTAHLPRGLSVENSGGVISIYDDTGFLGSVRVLTGGSNAPARLTLSPSREAALATFPLDPSGDSAVLVSPAGKDGGAGTGGWTKRLSLPSPGGGASPRAFIHLDGWLRFEAEGRELRSGAFRGELLALAVSRSPRLGGVFFLHARYDGRILENGLPESELGPGKEWFRLSSFKGPMQWRLFAVGEPENIGMNFAWGGRKTRVRAFRYVPGEVVSGKDKSPSVRLRGRGGWAVRFLPPLVPGTAQRPLPAVLESAEPFAAPFTSPTPADIPAAAGRTGRESLLPPEPAAAGFRPVVRDPLHPRFLARSGKETTEPFVPVGRNTAWLKNPLDEYPALFERMRRNGENTCRIWSASWHLPLAGRGLSFRREQENAAAWDYILMKAWKHGVKVVMTLSCAYDTLERPGFLPGSGGKAGLPHGGGFFRYLSEASARFWAFESVLYLEPMNEPDYAFREAAPGAQGRPRYGKWFREWTAAAVEAVRDPSGRPVTCGMSDAAAALAVSDLVDILQIHSYLPHTGEERTVSDFSAAGKVALAVRLLSGAGKPVLVGEFGRRPPKTDPLAAEAPSQRPDVSGLLLRDAIWSSLVSGAAGAAWPWWWADYVEKYRLGRRMAAAARFLERVRLYEVAGRFLPVAVPPEATAVCSRGTAGASAYVLFERPPAEDFTMSIPGLRPRSAYELSFFDPDTGEEISATLVESDRAGTVRALLGGGRSVFLFTLERR